MGASSFNGPSWRLDRAESDIKLLQEQIRSLPVLEERVRQLIEKEEDLQSEMRSMRIALYTASISVAAGASIFAFTIFQVFK